MEYLIIIVVAFGAALLTFFSGFGLGTILMPVFALFFPVEIAIGLTAVVHLANNLFKSALIWKHIRFRVVLWFALPATAAAFGGALLLNALSDQVVLLTYSVGRHTLEVTPLKLVIAFLLALFAVLEIGHPFEKVEMKRAWLPLGGLLSGFFGGLSGHQGALRSLFLLRAGLGKEGFIATGIAAAVLIDISRLSVYGTTFLARQMTTTREDSKGMLIAATLAAFIGSLLGRRVLKKVTYRSVQVTVGVLILITALLMGAGIN